MLTRILLRACVVAALASIPASSGAASVTYRCAPNLCRIAQDGSGQTQLTTDGQAGTALAYGAPSLSRDGTKLAFTYDNRAVVADANAQNRGTPFASGALLMLMRPDGGAVAELEALVGSQVCTYALDGSGRNCPYGTGSAGWAPDNNLLISVSAGAPNYNKEICHVPAAANTACSDVKADNVASDLYDPSVSPDGATLAVTSTGAIGGATRGHIALYSYASGAFLRDLTSGSTDETPTWSPDGSTIAFTRGDSIYTIAAGGAAGSETLLTAGDSPTWGPTATAPGSGPDTGPGTTPGPTTPALKPKLGTIASSLHLTSSLKVPVTCVAGCRITIKLTLSTANRRHFHLTSTTLATTSKSLTKAGASTLKLAISSLRGKHLRHHSVKATLTVTVTPAGAKAVTFTRTLTVKG